jgi:hypothetical protein
MKEKINKILSSKTLLGVLLALDFLLCFSYGISGAITFGQRISFLLGNIIVLFLLFAVAQNVTKKSNIFNISLVIIIYWVFYFFVMPIIR